MRAKDIRRKAGGRAAICPGKTRRVGELVRLFGHAAGGRVSERLLAGLGIPISCSAVLWQLNSHVRKHRETKPLRAIATDDWSWCEGFS
jgi:hypothetical protein